MSESKLLLAIRDVVSAGRNVETDFPEFEPLAAAMKALERELLAVEQDSATAKIVYRGTPISLQQTIVIALNELRGPDVKDGPRLAEDPEVEHIAKRIRDFVANKFSSLCIAVEVGRTTVLDVARSAELSDAEGVVFDEIEKRLNTVLESFDLKLPGYSGKKQGEKA